MGRRNRDMPSKNKRRKIGFLGISVPEEERPAVKSILKIRESFIDRIKKESPVERRATLNRMLKLCDSLEEKHWRHPTAVNEVMHLRARIATELAKLER